MQSLYDLSPAGLSHAFGEKHSKILLSRETTSLTDFLKMVSKNFIESVTKKQFLLKKKCFLK